MIVVRHSVVVDEPDERIEVDNACGVTGVGDVMLEAVSVGRTRVTLSVRLDLQPSDPETGRPLPRLHRRACRLR